ncbi:hypothetical protein N7G274_003928 [Stereocaulon virgatum]|uniref:OCRE domain-containing protein n=1 Tax=Stereocaulon virgatum TaxID=373712 RepID=A0ABR4AFL9_9LECA
MPQSSDQGGSAQDSRGSSGKGYNITSSGTNSQGNHLCNRDYTPSLGDTAVNKNAYHYSNQNGSYYYSNPDGTKYYNDGKGGAYLAKPDGDVKKYGTYSRD